MDIIFISRLSHFCLFAVKVFGGSPRETENGEEETQPCTTKPKNLPVRDVLSPSASLDTVAGAGWALDGPDSGMVSSSGPFAQAKAQHCPALPSAAAGSAEPAVSSLLHCLC